MSREPTADQPAIEVPGSRGLHYRLALDPSGLFLVIETISDGKVIGSGFLSRFDIDAVVAGWHRLEQQASVLAQARNTALYGAELQYDDEA